MTTQWERVLAPPGTDQPVTYNFSGGPGALPEIVLAEAQEAIAGIPGQGLSVLGISHRSKWFADLIEEAEANFRTLLRLPGHFRVLFLQGGGSLQFAMAPLNLIDHLHDAPDYLDTGYWSTLAIKEANRIRPVNVLWSGASEGYRRLPAEGELRFNPSAAYFHYVSNETVEGLQFQRIPGLEDVLCVCDMSSDLLAQPLDMGRYGLVYAHAQKNLGPAGVTVAIIRQDALDRAPESLPKILNYRTHAAANSIYNTPPVFAVYVTVLVTRWLRDEIGGLVAMEAVNRKKAALLYEAIDTSGGFYRGHAAPADRSIMNVSFRLPSPELDKQFAAEALAARLHGLGGHRSVGGVRASIYNAVTVPAVERLCAFMEYFRGMHADQIEPC